MEKSWYPQVPYALQHCPTQDEELVWCLTYGRQQLMLQLIFITNLNSVTDKYQTGVVSSTYYSPTVAVGDWNINCMCRRFVMTSFFLVDGYAYSWSFCTFFGVVVVNIFSSVNKSDANVIEWIFLSNSVVGMCQNLTVFCKSEIWRFSDIFLSDSDFWLFLLSFIALCQ